MTLDLTQIAPGIGYLYYSWLFIIADPKIFKKLFST
jgi:hypothetical protein